jgi:hypothetical protein
MEQGESACKAWLRAQASWSVQACAAGSRRQRQDYDGRRGLHWHKFHYISLHVFVPIQFVYPAPLISFPYYFKSARWSRLSATTPNSFSTMLASKIKGSLHKGKFGEVVEVHATAKGALVRREIPPGAITDLQFVGHIDVRAHFHGLTVSRGRALYTERMAHSLQSIFDEWRALDATAKSAITSSIASALMHLDAHGFAHMFDTQGDPGAVDFSFSSLSRTLNWPGDVGPDLLRIRTFIPMA